MQLQTIEISKQILAEPQHANHTLTGLVEVKFFIFLLFASHRLSCANWADRHMADRHMDGREIEIRSR